MPLANKSADAGVVKMRLFSCWIILAVNTLHKTDSDCFFTQMPDLTSAVKGNTTSMAFHNVQRVRVTYISCNASQTRAEEQGRSFVSGP